MQRQELGALCEKEARQCQEQEIENLSNIFAEIHRLRYWQFIRWLWGQSWYLKIRNIFLSKHQPDIFGIMKDKSNVAEGRSKVTHSASACGNVPSIASPKSDRFSERELQWLEQTLLAKPDAIAVLHPEWRGIYASAAQQFKVLLEIPDNLDPDSAIHYANLLAETKCSRIVMSGFPVSYRYLVLALRKRLGSSSKIFIIYHGQYNQYREDYDRLSYSTTIDLAKAGKVDKVGFVKAGMAEIVHAATGISTEFVMNWVENVPARASQPLEGGPHLGVWLLWAGNWRKPPFSMLASSILIPGSIIHGADADERVLEYVNLMNIRAEFTGRPLDHEELLEKMAKMHLNLYVTFHECAPMLPLESLSVGAPCLLGPVSHYFEDEPYLHQRLVVPYPERAEIIAAYAQKAIEEREQIIQAYRNYAPEYNRRAKEQLQKFLDLV